MGRTIAYRPGSSTLHRLHPLTKTAWLLFGTACVFVLRSPWLALAVLGLVLLAFRLARLSLRQTRGTRLFTVTALVLGLLQVLFSREGTVLAQAGPLTVTSDGVEAGLYVAARFLTVVLLSYLFVLTTDPNDLAYALMQAGLPYRFGFALITALRLVPIFEQEGQIVYQAQLTRGIRYDAPSPRRFLTLTRQFLLPLLISALGKVDGLAISMEGRCFGKYPTRTFLREMRPARRDVMPVALLLAAAVGLLLVL